MTNTIGKVTDAVGLTNIEEQRRAGKAGQEASRLQAGYEQRALDYMQEQDRLPSELRTGALTQLGALQGLGGDQEAAMLALQNSPMYQAIMAGQEQGEAAILRNAGMTGGMRSGNTQGALGKYSQDLNLQALMAGLGGLTQLSQLPSYSRDIAGMTGGIGQTMAQGDMARAQGRLAGSQSFVDAMRQERQYGHEVGMSFLGGGRG